MSPNGLILRGPTVTLVPLAFEHVAELVAAASENRVAYSWTLVPEGHAAMAEYVASALSHAEQGHQVPFATVVNGRVVGSTRFARIERWHPSATSDPGAHASGCPDSVEIGFTWLADSAQGAGVNTEAKFLQMRHAFDVWNVKRLGWRVDENNVRSRRAIERLGGVFEGVLRNHMPSYTQPGPRNSAFYSMLPNEWPPAKAALHRRLGLPDVEPERILD